MRARASKNSFLYLEGATKQQEPTYEQHPLVAAAAALHLDQELRLQPPAGLVLTFRFALKDQRKFS